MNGVMPPDKPMKGLEVSLDSRTLAKAIGHRPLKNIEPSGELVYDTSIASSKLAERIERIWNEYPSGFLDISEGAIAQLSADEPAVKEITTNQHAEQEEDKGGLMTREDMEQLRADVFGQMNDARNELWFLLELAKTLAQSGSYGANPPDGSNESDKPKGRQHPGKKPGLTPAIATAAAQTEPPVLPPGTYSTTPGKPVPPPNWKAILELEVALDAKQKAVDECSSMIDAAVSELQAMSKSTDRFWKDVRDLKSGRGGSGQWAIIPKPDFGRSMAAGEPARDIVIPYASDEANPSLRLRSLAAFDLNPKKEDSLAFGARSYQRLRVTFSDGNGQQISSIARARGDSVHNVMEEAQSEAFDEELFNEIRAEALQSSSAHVGTDNIRATVGDMEVQFALVDSRLARSTDTPSPYADLLLHTARLNLLQLHRFRKGQMVLPSSRTSRPAPPKILQPIREILDFQQQSGSIRATLDMLASTINSSRISANVTTRSSFADHSGSVVENLLRNQGWRSQIGSTFNLSISGSRGATVSLAMPSSVTVTTSKATFLLVDTSELAQIIADDLADQLLLLVKTQVIERLGEDRASRVFLDELEALLVVGNGQGISVDLPAPFDAIIASVQGAVPSASEVTPTYTSKSGEGLIDWAYSIASRAV